MRVGRDCLNPGRGNGQPPLRGYYTLCRGGAGGTGLSAPDVGGYGAEGWRGVAVH